MTYTYHARKGISTPVQIVLITLVIIVILGAIIVFAKQDVNTGTIEEVNTLEPITEESLPVNDSDEVITIDEPTLEEGETNVVAEKILELPSEEIAWTGTVLAGTNSPLLNFNQEDYAIALDSDKIVVLYFYANWCPSCKIEVSTALYPAFNELERTDVVGFRVNFNDNQTEKFEKELASEFGIAYQHSKVFLRDGVRVLKSPESWTKERYLEEIDNFKN